MYRLLSTSVARSLNEQSRRKYATLWLRHGCPWSIGFGDPRSQKRDLGHPSRFSFGFGWEGKFTYGLEPVPFTYALLFLELLASELQIACVHQRGVNDAALG
jgi:hypothetical protein